MDENNKTYQELIEEIAQLKRKLKDIELSEAIHEKREKALSLELERMRLLINTCPDFFFLKDLAFRYQLINAANLKCFNLNEDEVLGKTDIDLMSVEAATRCQETDRQAIDEKRPVVSIEKVGDRYYETNKFPVFDKERIIGVAGIVRDATDHMLSEIALRESEEKFYKLFQNHSAVKLIIDPDTGSIIDANDAAANFYGWSIEDLKKMHIYQINQLPKEKVETCMKAAERGLKKSFEFKHLKADGSVCDVEVFSNKIEFELKSVLFSIIHDITPRKQAEEAILKEKEKLKTLSENAPFGMVLIDNGGRFIYENNKFTEIFGFEPGEITDGKTWFKKAFPEKEYRRTVVSAWIDDFKDAKPGERRPRVFNVTCKDGTQKVINFASVMIDTGDYLVICEDITEMKKIEDQLFQAQKMESIGTLAGGIAHGFNNLLMGIQGYVSLMLLELDTSHPNYAKLKRIEEQIKSGASLTAQLLGFERTGRYDVKPTNINDIIQKTSLLFAKTRKEIVINQKYAKNLPSVEVDRGQMEQVLMNLLINAWQAMPGGGEICLETDSVMIDEKMAFPYNIRQGKYIKISITDTGTGMDEETRSRVFEPFFTTKEMDRGAGLGLATVYGIIKGHKGFINVYSEPGHGTTFTIYLPASVREIEEDKRPIEVIKKGEGTILLVDDEKAVLDVAKAMLESLGYKVYAAKNGQTAIDIFKERHQEIDIVIMDMIMPGLSGAETFDRLQGIKHDVKVVLSSGYSLNGEANRIMGKGCSGFLQKPFSLETLASKIKEIQD